MAEEIEFDLQSLFVYNVIEDRVESTVIVNDLTTSSNSEIEDDNDEPTTEDLDCSTEYESADDDEGIFSKAPLNTLRIPSYDEQQLHMAPFQPEETASNYTADLDSSSLSIESESDFNTSRDRLEDDVDDVLSMLLKFLALMF